MISIPLPVHWSTWSMVDNTIQLIIVNVVTLCWMLPCAHPVLLVSMIVMWIRFLDCRLIGHIPILVVLPVVAMGSYSCLAVLPLLSHLLQELSERSVLPLTPVLLWVSPATIHFPSGLVQHSVLLHSSTVLGVAHIFHMTSGR